MVYLVDTLDLSTQRKRIGLIMNLEQLLTLWENPFPLAISIDGETDVNLSAEPVEILDDYGESLHVKFSDGLERDVAFLAPARTKQVQAALLANHSNSNLSGKSFVGKVRVKDGDFERTELRLVKAEDSSAATRLMLIGEAHNPECDTITISDHSLNDDGRIIIAFDVNEISDHEAAFLRAIGV